MIFEPKLTQLAAQDFRKLAGSQKKHILKSFAKIGKSGMQTGQELHGKLWDCRKLKHKKLGLRVIFRQSDLGIEIIEIVVIGKREDSDVYNEAVKRLGR
jgi:mRNA interferase RelE/StbE